MGFSATTTYKIYINQPLGEVVFFPEASVQSWSQVPAVLSETKFQTDDGIVRFNFDWGETPEYILACSKDTLANYLVNGKLVVPEDRQARPPLELTCAVHNPTRIQDDYYIQYILCQIFFALNLSSPGCCSLYNTSIQTKERLIEGRLGLSGFYFCESFELSQKLGWPHITAIPLSETWNWIEKVNPHIRVIAQSRIERILYAILHVCRMVGFPVPTEMIWLAHALEALFDTPGLGVSKALRDRIFLVLGIPQDNLNSIRKSINSFYSVRSSFVHGRSDIAHPLGSQKLGDDAEKQASAIINEVGFAFSIISAALQTLVLNKWKILEFEEVVSGLPLS